MKIIPTNNGVGCFIETNLKKIKNDELLLIKKTLDNFGVIFFKKQELNPKEYISLAKHWGDLAEYPMLKGHDNYPEITIVERKPEDKGSNFGGEFFHTDSSYTQKPPRFTFLMGVDVPGKGLGNTIFANQYLAYKNLPEDIKIKINSTKGVFSSAGPIAKTRIERERERGTGKAKNFKAIHNLVKEISGKKTIYCSPGHVVSLENCKENEKETLKKFLFDHQIKKEFTYSYSWDKGDIICWDNRSMIHKASEYNGKRIMYRITVQ